MLPFGRTTAVEISLTGLMCPAGAFGNAIGTNLKAVKKAIDVTKGVTDVDDMGTSFQPLQIRCISQCSLFTLSRSCVARRLHPAVFSAMRAPVLTQCFPRTGNHEPRIEPAFYRMLLDAIPAVDPAGRLLVVVDMNNINTADVAAINTPPAHGRIIKLVRHTASHTYVLHKQVLKYILQVGKDTIDSRAAVAPRLAAQYTESVSSAQEIARRMCPTGGTRSATHA